MKCFLKSLILALALAASLVSSHLRADEAILVEAESFADPGGWELDTQFIRNMGSPYLLAHGLGEPVEDAVTTVDVPASATYRVWVRTKDWVAPWDAPGTPGRFQLVVDGEALETEFGTTGAEWHWQDGGEVALEKGELELRLRDLTGFNGRCDAIVFSTGDEAPDNTSDVLPAWRREMLGYGEAIEDAGEFDIVFIGGGYAGTCGAISAARMGLKVALIQDRDVLGGNGSSEVRVWAKGNTPGGLYPVGDIVREIEDHAASSPGTYEEFGDDRKERIVRAEDNLSLFLGHFAYDVTMSGDGRQIEAVQALEVRSGRIREFSADFFCDSTGHGTIALVAGADTTMEKGGRMGMSNMWRWQNTDSPKEFPETPWALDLDETGFPYPKRHHAEWFWESGYDKHPLDDLELIRDWNLRANFGAWNAIKNKGAYDRYDRTGNKHANAELTWMAYIGGTRETLQVLGDVILTADDVSSAREFEDGCVLTTWSIDLHYPKEQYIGEYADNPFISYAEHDRAVDRTVGYAVPYRCFYSRNIENLFTAGRNVSVTHEALGTVRVMKTGGMMGVVVGKAAAVAEKHDTTPRGVYETYLPELIELLKLPGNQRRATLEDAFTADPALPALEPMSRIEVVGGVEIEDVPGIVIDDSEARVTGQWGQNAYGRGFVGPNYKLSKGANAEARYEFEVPESGEWEIRFSWVPRDDRSTDTTIRVERDGAVIEEMVVDQTKAAGLGNGWHSLNKGGWEKGTQGAVVVIGGDDPEAPAVADAVQLLQAE